MNITDKQAKFISEYTKDFNATQAAIRAGYSPKTAYSIGQRLLKNVEVQAAMKEHRKKFIADRETRQKFWTDTMQDKDEDMKNRLRASELLAKSECDFIERAEIKNEAQSQCEQYDLSKLTDEELYQLKNLLEKAKP